MHCKEEVEAFQRIAAALVVNVGTLTPAWVESMHLAAAAANAAGHPWVLDPVGAGATEFRTQVGPRRVATPACDLLNSHCRASWLGVGRPRQLDQVNARIQDLYESSLLVWSRVNGATSH